jgi:hypothetical protein
MLRSEERIGGEEEYADCAVVVLSAVVNNLLLASDRQPTLEDDPAREE